MNLMILLGIILPEAHETETEKCKVSPEKKTTTTSPANLKMRKTNQEIAQEIIDYRMDKPSVNSNEFIYLDCSYSEKDRVRMLGGKWNGILKRWYITSTMDKEPFKKWIKNIT